jgi:putative Holliday junction resolvase
MRIETVDAFSRSQSMRVLAVDHGEKRIGLAVSDPSGTIANPLGVLLHTSLDADVHRVIALADEHQASLILVGQSFHENGQPNLAGRRAARFADCVRSNCKIPVEMWDESFSSQDAHAALIQMRASRKRRAGRLDAQAATVILQSYLDAQTNSRS